MWSKHRPRHRVKKQHRLRHRVKISPKTMGLRDDEQEVEELTAEELIVTLYFDPSLDLLQPLLKFSDPKAVRDIELQHAATTLKLPDEAHGFLQEGLGIPQLVFQLALNWRGASCHKLIEVKDTTQPTEVVCK